MKERKILRIAGVCEVTGAKPPTIYEWVRKGRFPKPVKLGPRFSGWYSDEVQEWINSRPRS
jgi:prophage regulatory protein